ncbi:MAG: DsbA family protein [Nitriliruptoraceae bacterium]|nr:DsbA family protein [Nitriliruptoraceae bacterium]
MLTCYFDLTSPASAVAVLRLQALADRGADVGFVGVDVLGLAVSVPATLDQLAEHERCHERARVLGLAMRRPTSRPPTLDAHLVGEVADARGLGASWRSVCLRAYFADGADLADHQVLHDLGRQAGLTDDVVATRLADAPARRALRARMTTLRKRGVGGVPLLEAGPGNLVSAELSDEDLASLAAL